MTDLDQRLKRLRSLFDEFTREANKLLRDITEISGAPAHTIPRPRIVCIQHTVAELFGVNVSAMHTKARPQSIAVPRMVSMTLCRDLTTHSLETIGLAHGGRDHGTVSNAARSISARIDTSPQFAAQFATAKAICAQRIANLDMPLFSR